MTVTAQSVARRRDPKSVHCCRGGRAWEREDAQTLELEEQVPFWVDRKLLYLSGQALNSRGDEFTRPTLREPSCERKGGMSFEYRVIRSSSYKRVNCKLAFCAFC